MGRPEQVKPTGMQGGRQAGPARPDRQARQADLADQVGVWSRQTGEASRPDKAGHEDRPSRQVRDAAQARMPGM